MSFFKRKCNLNITFNKILGKILFLSTYALIFFQAYGTFLITDEIHKNNSYLSFYKCFLFILIILSIISHFRAAYTNPGKITHENNFQFLEFYCTTRTIAVKRSEFFNKSAGSRLLRPPVDIDDDPDDNFSDYENDDNEYTPSTVFTDEKINELNKEYGYSFNLCKKCNVGRMPGAHHCSQCAGCIYQMDHHCPWLDNCVGQFNQKFFILFCFYSNFASIVSTFISLHYVVYKYPLR
jgi:hypothetical protein